VHKSFGDTHVVRGVDLEIADGEFLVLVGGSGCGKSTLLRMIAGLESPTTGDIRIDDRSVLDVRPRDRDIAMVFQSYALYPHMSVRDNMSFGLKVRGEPPSEIAEKVTEAAKILDIEHLLDRRPKALSGGQRQRVAMGRALVRKPKVFLFDEPLSNLDASLRSQMRVELKRLHAKLRITTVYVTHDQVEAMTLADRIALMNAGVMSHVGTPRELYDWPANRYTAGFIGSPGMNFVDATLSRDGALRAPAITLQASPDFIQSARDAEVIVGVRPHDLHLRSPRPGSGFVEARVDVMEPMGWETHAHIRVQDRPWIARLDADAAATLAPGDEVSLYVDPGQVRLFDPADGRALCSRPTHGQGAARDGAAE